MDFTWSLLLGTELQFTNSLSLHLGGRFLGLWSEFGENEFTVDTGITWWFDAIHGVSLEYQRAFEARASLLHSEVSLLLAINDILK